MVQIADRSSVPVPPAKAQYDKRVSLPGSMQVATSATPTDWEMKKLS